MNLFDFLRCPALVINVLISAESLTSDPPRGCDLATCWGWCRVWATCFFWNFNVLISFLENALFTAHCLFLFFSCILKSFHQNQKTRENKEIKTFLTVPKGFKDAASSLHAVTFYCCSLLTHFYMPKSISGETVQQQLNIVFGEEASCRDAWKIICLSLQQQIGSFAQRPHSLFLGKLQIGKAF